MTASTNVEPTVVHINDNADIPLTRHDACALLGIRMTTLHKLIASGALESFCVGRRRLITRQAVADYKQRNTRRATA